MNELHQFSHGHLLQFLSAPNQHLVAHYLTVLQTRQYSPRTLDLLIRALKSFCDLLPETSRGRVVEDFATTTPDDIDAWLQAAYHKGLAASTIQTTLSALRRFFAFFHTEGHFSQQPIRPYRHDVVVPQSLPRPMAQDDLVAFFRVIDSLRDRLMFLLMLRCGLRVGEVQRLTWSAIHWDQETLRIDNSKGQVDRVVYYSPDVAQALKQWQGLRRDSTPYLFPSPFQRKAGQPISRRLIQNRMTTYLTKAHIPTGYSAHCLRHSFATDLLNAGAPLEVVKDLMGHRTLDMALRYAQLYDVTKRAQYDHAMTQVERRPL